MTGRHDQFRLSRSPRSAISRGACQESFSAASCEIWLSSLASRAVLNPDYDTQVLDIDDRELARWVLRFRPTWACATAR